MVIISEIKIDVHRIAFRECHPVIAVKNIAHDAVGEFCFVRVVIRRFGCNVIRICHSPENVLRLHRCIDIGSQI